MPKTKLKREDFANDQSFKLAQQAVNYMDQANDLIDDKMLVLDGNNRIVTGRFIIDFRGFPGIGILEKNSKYTHLFGGAKEEVEIDEETEKEKTVKKIWMNTTKENVDEYFQSLQFFDRSNVVTLKA